MGHSPSPRPPKESWPVTWAANREDQLTRTLAATPAQRLTWLEEMIRVAFLAGAFPERSGNGGDVL